MVTQCRLAHAACSLHLDKERLTVWVWIEQPLLVHRTGQIEVLLDPSDGEEQLRPAFGLLGMMVENGVAYAGGRLEVSFEGGSRLSVDHSAEFEAWEVTSSQGLRIVSTPGGELAVWRERAED
jgi:hypothetical protein